MRKISIDFQPARPGLFSVILLMAAFLLAADTWLDHGLLSEQLEESGSRLATAERRIERSAAAHREIRPENVFSADETKALRLAVSAIRIDWELLYRHIDRATGEDVALLAVQPSVPGKSVLISGEARDMAATLAFVEALQQKPLARATLLSHQIKQSDPQQPIAFEISAIWLTDS